MTPHARILLTLLIVFALMGVEAWRSRQNERRLRRRGAMEPPGDVYPPMQVLYPLAFVLPAVEGWLVPRGGAAWWMSGVAVFAAGKAIKYWAIAVLGDRWTFRVLVLPGAPLVRRGPYRVLRHPNYVGVAGEIAGAALLCAGPWTGAVLTLAFAALMRRRIHVEERALAQWPE
jgi:methyltransferase